MSVDRDELVGVLSDEYGIDHDRGRVADRILALDRSPAGITLTPEDAAYVARWLPTRNSQRARDLAERLAPEQQNLTRN